MTKLACRTCIPYTCIHTVHAVVTEHISINEERSSCSGAWKGHGWLHAWGGCEGGTTRRPQDSATLSVHSLILLLRAQRLLSDDSHATFKSPHCDTMLTDLDLGVFVGEHVHLAEFGRSNSDVITNFQRRHRYFLPALQLHLPVGWEAVVVSAWVACVFGTTATFPIIIHCSVHNNGCSRQEATPFNASCAERQHSDQFEDGGTAYGR